MSLSYHFAFSAPIETEAEQLEEFLHEVEDDAKDMGFNPVLVIDAAFDTPERQRFARRLTTGMRLESKNLKGAVNLQSGQVWSHDSMMGSCRVIPKQAVVLIVTDENQQEMVFGFLRYPEALLDTTGKEIVRNERGNRWAFQNFVDSPDARYREIVKRFAQAGYLDSEKDEFSE